jgi:Ca2+-binding RTX toxin-like protein
VINGGPGDDVATGNEAPDHLNGGDGNDDLDGGSGGDEINGGFGNDIIHSDTGPDRIDAGPGDDQVYVNSGSAVTSVDCGEGNDTIFINPRDKPGGISNDQAIREGRIKNCETITPQAAEVDPTRGITWQGDGTKHGTDKNDKLLGQHGSGQLYGKAGDDILWADAAGGTTAQSRRAKDYVSGGPGKDTIYGGRGSNTLDGGDDDDYIQGNGSRNTISGGGGADQIRVTTNSVTKVDAGAGDDVITAVISNGHATIKCGPGKDTVLVSKFTGNRRRVTVAKDCEVRKKG